MTQACHSRIREKVDTHYAIWKCSQIRVNGVFMVDFSLSQTCSIEFRRRCRKLENRPTNQPMEWKRTSNVWRNKRDKNETKWKKRDRSGRGARERERSGDKTKSIRNTTRQIETKQIEERNVGNTKIEELTAHFKMLYFDSVEKIYNSRLLGHWRRALNVNFTLIIWCVGVICLLVCLLYTVYMC